MKNSSIKFLGLFAIVATLFFASCDPCSDVECQNGGTCAEGVCTCADGYEGTNCETRMTTKFVGAYTVAESCPPNNYNYASNVSESSTEATRINFSNFYDLSGFYGVSTPVYGTVSGTDVTIPTQTITNGANTFSFSGT